MPMPASPTQASIQQALDSGFKSMFPDRREPAIPARELLPGELFVRYDRPDELCTLGQLLRVVADHPLCSVVIAVRSSTCAGAEVGGEFVTPEQLVGRAVPLGADTLVYRMQCVSALRVTRARVA